MGAHEQLHQRQSLLPPAQSLMASIGEKMNGCVEIETGGRWAAPFASICLLLGCFSMFGEAAVKPPSNQLSQATIPMAFEINHGQTDSEVKFLTRGRGYNLFLTANECVLSLRDRANRRSAALRMDLAGANSRPEVEALEPLEGKVNYFL